MGHASIENIHSKGIIKNQTGFCLLLVGPEVGEQLNYLQSADLRLQDGERAAPRYRGAQIHASFPGSFPWPSGPSELAGLFILNILHS